MTRPRMLFQLKAEGGSGLDLWVPMLAFLTAGLAGCGLRPTSPCQLPALPYAGCSPEQSTEFQNSPTLRDHRIREDTNETKVSQHHFLPTGQTNILTLDSVYW